MARKDTTTTTAAAATSSIASTSCPYAVSLSDHEDDDGDVHVEELLEVAVSSCPAFVHGGCPFSNAKNATDVQQALLDLPPSHLSQQGHNFLKALTHLHQVSQHLMMTPTTTSTTTNKFALQGGCPVQSNSNSKNMSFAQAMEERSLASIMARMAQDVMDRKDQQEEEEQGDDDDDDDNDQMTPPSLTPSDATALTKKNRSNEAFVSEKAPDDDEHVKKQDEVVGVSLSQALKTGTAGSHQAAENVHFVRNFIQGSIDRKLYGELVLSLHHVYACLEEKLNMHAPFYFKSCHFPLELSRTAALQEDVDFWHGAHTKQQRRVSPATLDYIHRLEYLSNHDPLLLLAHAYTRYLGDLSGGKILARVARKAMQLGDDGLDFYTFEHIASAKTFKEHYRQALDGLELTSHQVTKLVGEANVAFVLNMRLFEELDVLSNIPGATVRPYQEALDYATPPSLSQEPERKCPFAPMSTKSGGETTKSSTEVKCPWTRTKLAVFHMALHAKRRIPWSSLVLSMIACWLWWHIVQNSNNVVVAAPAGNHEL